MQCLWQLGGNVKHFRWLVEAMGHLLQSCLLAVKTHAACLPHKKEHRNDCQKGRQSLRIICNQNKPTENKIRVVDDFYRQATN